MQHNIINTGQYLLIVDDSDIKEGDTYCRIDTGLLFSSLKGSNPNIIEKYCKKIIAHLPLNNSPILNGVDLLPPLEDDVEKLAEKWFQSANTERWGGEELGFVNGYNKAKEKYKYTEDDMRKVFNYGKGIGSLAMKDDFDEYIQSLQQPKMPVGFKCEVQILRERPTDIRNHVYDKTYEVPKTTTNSQGLTQWVGEYIY